MAMYSAGNRPATIERLSVGDQERLRRIRLRALGESPEAFVTTFEEASAWPPERWDQQLTQLATFVATEDGPASASDVGLVRGAKHDQFADAGQLISMWVAPEVRRRGIGSTLIAAVVAWARGEGFNRLFLAVNQANQSAIALYTRAGFAFDGVVRNFPPPRSQVRELEMVLQL
jgi:GNAT superfamily N-acetyltransferase